MSPSDARQLAYAKAVQARAGAMPPGGEPPLDIIDSWARCMDVGLDCHGHAPIAVVDGADLARRRERSELTRRLAQAELETLAQQIAGSNYLLAFADADGVILDLFFDHRFSTSGVRPCCSSAVTSQSRYIGISGNRTGWFSPVMQKRMN